MFTSVKLRVFHEFGRRMPHYRKPSEYPNSRKAMTEGEVVNTIIASMCGGPRPVSYGFC